MTRRFLIVAVASVLAIAGGTASRLLASPSVKDNPPPPLYADATVRPLATALAAQRNRADSLFAQWAREHGSRRDDAAFTAWAVAQVPAPPTGAPHTAEFQQVKQLFGTHSATGDAAATWLEAYGKKAIWKLYLGHHRDTVTSGEGKREKTELKDALDLTGAIVQKLQDRYGQSAPYVLDPALRPDKQVSPGDKCPCSYPSKHSAGSSAALTVLDSLDARRAPEYEWMAAQIAYSRLYASGHFQSDLEQGAFLGRLVGDYIVTANGGPVPDNREAMSRAAPV